MNKHKRGFTSLRHPELDSGSSRSMKGFTLIELLVVILIIGVLAAVALPQYNKALKKSRFSAVMPMAKSVADANEVYYLEKNMYALGQDDLDVTPVIAENTNVKLSGEYQNADENYEYVSAWRTDVPNVRYIVYQKHSVNFPDNIHCEAAKEDEQANALCVSLGGVLTEGGLVPGYATYILKGNSGDGSFRGPAVTVDLPTYSSVTSGPQYGITRVDTDPITLETVKWDPKTWKKGLDENGKQVFYAEYDALGRLRSFELSASSTYVFLDTSGNVERIQKFSDINGFRALTTYYPNGNVQSVRKDNITYRYYNDGRAYTANAPDISSVSKLDTDSLSWLDEWKHL